MDASFQIILVKSGNISQRVCNCCKNYYNYRKHMLSQIEEIKSRVDIVDLVGSYVRLQKGGANFKALCPFHNERTPSFNVSPARQIWHCFGCGKGGDAIQFVMDIEGVEFPDALKTLADRAGVELKYEDPKLKSERNRIFSLMDEAAKFFEGELAAFSEAGEYLKKRGLEDETIKTFRLGYAREDWRALSQHLISKGFKVDELERAGLVIKRGTTPNTARNYAEYYDRFRGRIMFPIFDYGGRIIAFGGRVFPEKENEAKYVNSPETALYQKSRTLYGLHKSKTEILKANACVLVEGYMDMIMSWQAGVKNVVAVSGTALTQDQLKILRRISEKLIVSFDMDLAGESASRRGIDLAQAEGFDVKIVKLEGVKDPADAAMENPQIWSRAVEGARHIVQFYIDIVLKKHDASTPEAKKEFQQSVLPVISALSSDLERAHWTQEVAQVLNINEETIWNALGKIRNPKSEIRNNETILQNHPITRKKLLEEKVSGIIAEYPALISKLDPTLLLPNKTVVFAELFLSGIIEAEAELIKCQKELRKAYLKEQMISIASQIKLAEKSGAENSPELLEKFLEITSALNKL